MLFCNNLQATQVMNKALLWSDLCEAVLVIKGALATH